MIGLSILTGLGIWYLVDYLFDEDLLLSTSEEGRALQQKKKQEEGKLAVTATSAIRDINKGIAESEEKLKKENELRIQIKQNIASIQNQINRD